MRTALIVLSDRAASGERADGCLPVMRESLGPSWSIVRERVIPDDPDALQAELIDLCDGGHADLVLTSGGTGLGPRDRTPQATAAILDYPVPGISEAIRASAVPRLATAMLSRGVAGVRHRTLIVNLPGSPRAVAESIAAIRDALPHAVALLNGETNHGAP